VPINLFLRRPYWGGVFLCHSEFATDNFCQLGYSKQAPDNKRSFEMSKHAIDCVTFKLKPGTSVDTLMKESAALSEWIKTKPGFVSRRMGVDENGVWMDTTEWDSMANLKATSDAFMTAPEASGMMAIVDQASVGGYHIEVEDTLD
jgi:hypothetical protein